MVKYNKEILNFNEFLKSHLVDFNEKFNIWDDLIKIHKKTIPGRLDFDDYFWEMEISTINLDLDSESNQDIVVLLIFEFLIQSYPEKESIYCKKISKEIIDALTSYEEKIKELKNSKLNL